MEFLYLLVGLLVGALLGWLLGSRRGGGEPARLATAEERAKAEAERRADAERRLAEAQAAKTEVDRRIAAAEEQVRQAKVLLDEQKAFVAAARTEMENVFKAAAADALKGNNQQFLALANERLASSTTDAAAELEKRKTAIETLLAPLKGTLERLETSTQAIEKARVEAYAKVDEHVSSLAKAAAGIQRETVTLATALKGSQVRGRWGEVALRNIADLAGMSENVDYHEQRAAGDGRPDMTVRLPGGRKIAVDAKAPLDAYLEACAATDDAARDACLDRHASALRGHVKSLASKEYAANLDAGVDLVVLFLPGDPFLAAAFQRDPDMQVDALKQKVLIATPVTLVALLRTIALYHQQEALARDAAKIAEAARVLYERGVNFTEHLSSVGDGLDTALKAYNRAVGSFESRFLPAGKEIERLKVAEQVTKRLEPLTPVEGAPRRPQAAAGEPAA